MTAIQSVLCECGFNYYSRIAVMVFMLVTCCYEIIVIEVHLLNYWNGIVVKELQ